ncbi:tetratricopeptide repeat protein, partial [bacterium]
MAKIPLRAYNREIENQINRGQIDEAVGHCKHILRFFPKHIETYRLLGKAYLEGQHYAEASDVLQRVLSTVPDDFIAQIGMSIIREDEGN